jgi:hypothetical protein
VVLELIKNADYVLIIRSTAPPFRYPLASAQLLARQARVVEQTGAQVEQQRRIRQVAAHPLLVDVDSGSVQAIIMIQQLFDANIMLEDSGSHDFVGTLCKLSLEMVSMQSGVDVGAGAGCFGCGGDNIPCETTGASRATSLVTPGTKRFSRRMVSEIIVHG